MFQTVSWTNKSDESKILAPPLLQIDSSRGLELKSKQADYCQSPADSDRRRRRYSSPGEELVYREMVEQQMREKELRRHWKQVCRIAKTQNRTAGIEPEQG